MIKDHINLQEPKSNKIYGVIKMGANNSDRVLIKALQTEGYNEHEIQSKAGVHHVVIRTFMKVNDANFEETEADPTPDTKHLYDRIAELEAINKSADDQRVADSIAQTESVDDEED